MTSTKIPHLCGGTLFDLILEALKPRTKARNKLNGGSDGLKLSDVLAGLIYVVTGEDVNPYAGDTLKKCASNFKKCEPGEGAYLPFSDPSTVSAFHSEIERKSPDLQKRMSEFIEQYLNANKCEWLIRALIDLMQQDEAVDNSIEIAVSYTATVAVAKLGEVDLFICQPFLLSVLDYVLQNCPDAESGKATFESWYEQATPRSEWKFKKTNTIGQRIHPITVSFEEATYDAPVCDTPSPVSSSQDTEEVIDAEADRNLIIDNVSKALLVFADVLERQQHQIAEGIRASKKDSSAQAEDKTETDKEKTAEQPIVQQQTNVVQNGQNNFNLTNNGTMNFKL